MMELPAPGCRKIKYKWLHITQYVDAVPVHSYSRLIVLSARLLLATLLLVCPTLVHAADFVIRDIQGKTHRLADYRGKWVLVNFWATWCSPCLSEIPELISLHNAHKDKDLLVIGIAMESGSRKKVADFARKHGISYPVVLGDFKTAKQIGVVDVLPSSYLYNSRGEQVSYQAGEVTRASVETYIRNKLLK